MIYHLLHTTRNTVSSTDLYADDTTFYVIRKDKDILQVNLNVALAPLETGCINNGMQLNMDKTNVIIISTCRRKRDLHVCQLRLTCINIVLGQNSGETLPGVYIQDDLKWDTHVQSICKKTSSYIWLFYRIRDFFNITTISNFVLKSIYTNYKPHLDYCAIIWRNTSVINS